MLILSHRMLLQYAHQQQFITNWKFTHKKAIELLIDNSIAMTDYQVIVSSVSPASFNNKPLACGSVI